MKEPPWAVKNLFELKNARRVLIESNIFEHNWPHAQNGFAILFTVRNQDGARAVVGRRGRDVPQECRPHVAAGFNILGRDDNHESRQTSRISIHNNLITDVGGSGAATADCFNCWTERSACRLLTTPPSRPAVSSLAAITSRTRGFVFRNNVMPDNGAGFVGSGTGVGKASIDRYFPGAVIAGNVFVGGKPEHYPPDNFFTREDAPRPGDTALPGDARGPMEQLITPAAVLFWLALALLVYVYLGYPLIAWLRQTVVSAAVARAPIEPLVTVVVVAHNEGHRIGRRIENLLASDYPRDRLDDHRRQRWLDRRHRRSAQRATRIRA